MSNLSECPKHVPWSLGSSDWSNEVDGMACLGVVEGVYHLLGVLLGDVGASKHHFYFSCV